MFLDSDRKGASAPVPVPVPSPGGRKGCVQRTVGGAEEDSGPL